MPPAPPVGGDGPLPSPYLSLSPVVMSTSGLEKRDEMSPLLPPLPLLLPATLPPFHGVRLHVKVPWLRSRRNNTGTPLEPSASQWITVVPFVNTLMVLKSRPAPLQDKSNRVTRWSILWIPLGWRKDRSDQSDRDSWVEMEAFWRLSSSRPQPSVVTSDPLSSLALEHWPLEPKLRVRRLSDDEDDDDDDDGWRWYRAIFSKTFCASLILSKFKSPPVPWKAKNWSSLPISDRCYVVYENPFIYFKLKWMTY